MSVDFDPVRLGPRGRRVDPVIIGVAGVVIALALAVVKPWDQGIAPVRPQPSVVAVTGSTGRASGSPAPRPTTRPVQAVTAGPPTWADIASAVTNHDAWGVHTLVVDRRGDRALTGPATYIDIWTAASTAGGRTEMAAVDPGVGLVDILGITTPHTEAPRDARIWRVHLNDTLEWIDAEPIASEPTVASLLFVRPGTGGAPLTQWSAGRYLVDVLTGDGIHRTSVVIPDLEGVVPPLDAWTPARPTTIDAGANDPSGIRVGMFATVDGVGMALPARQTRLLDDDAAWLDLSDEQNDVVATVYQPRASGLGVMLTSHADVSRAIIRRLAPEGAFTAPRATGGISSNHGRTPYVLFAPPDNGVWPPGVYAISVSWVDGAGAHEGTWHVELRPGVG